MGLERPAINQIIPATAGWWLVFFQDGEETGREPVIAWALVDLPVLDGQQRGIEDEFEARVLPVSEAGFPVRPWGRGIRLLYDPRPETSFRYGAAQSEHVAQVAATGGDAEDVVPAAGPDGDDS